MQCEGAKKTILGHRRFVIGRVNGKRARLRIYLPRALFSPPLRFARVKSKNRPIIGCFSLHKSTFLIFMRAMREERKHESGEYGYGGRACALKLPAQQFVCPLSFLRPLRLARVKSKNRPKIGGFGLHKTGFSVFMRAIREGEDGF